MAVNVAVTQDAAKVGTGTQSFTIAGFGTPKAAMFLISKGTVAGTPVADAIIGGGWTDGSTDVSWVSTMQDNVGTSNTRRRGATDECIMITLTDGNVDGEAAFSQWVTDGVEVNWGNAPAAAYLVTVVLFGGTDLSAYVATGNHTGNVGVEQDFEGVGFQPDVVLFGGLGGAFADSNSTYALFTLGWAVDDGSISQSGHALGPNHAESTSLSGSYQANNLVNMTLDVGGGSPGLSRGIEVTDWIADGFSATKRGGSNSDFHFSYLALFVNSAISYSAANFTSPTSTGNLVRTAAGFTPQCVLILASCCDSINTLELTSAGGATALGVSIFDDTREYCVGISDEDAQGTTDTQSLAATNALDVDDPTGANMFAGTFVSMDAGNGYTLNLSATDEVTPRHWAELCFGANAVGGRTTKNTDPNPLGVNLAVSRRVPSRSIGG